MMEAKKVSMEALENVNGGTVSEFTDLVSALTPNGVLNGCGKISSHLPIGNQKTAEVVEDILKQHGIDAKIDLGWWGTGIGSEKNTYVNANTGARMSHGEVLDYLKARLTFA